MAVMFLIPFSHVHQNRVEPRLVNLGSTRLSEFRSHVPVSRGLCRPVTLVTAKMAYEDGLLVTILFIFLWLQQRCALARRTHLSREAARRRRMTHFLLQTKAKANVFPSSDFEQFYKGDSSAVRTIGVKPRNHTYFYFSRHCFASHW